MLNYFRITKLVYKTAILLLPLTLFWITGCDTNDSQKNSLPRFIYADLITPGLYLEKYCIYESGAGVFDTGTDYKLYLTDSSTLRVELGVCHEEEFYDLRLHGNQLIVKKIYQERDMSDLSDIIYHAKVIDSTTYHLQKLGFNILPTQTLTPEQVQVELNRVEENMLLLKGDTFSMGGDWSADQLPVHKITLADFYLSKFEVTQRLWTAVMNDNPSCFRNCGECPVENVSWNEVHVFLDRLNRLTSKDFRLPTEAEWEFAAKGGSHRKNYKYSGSDLIGQIAWYDENSNNKTHPVGQKKPNELGLFDLSGNVGEWCSDWYADTYDSCLTATVNPMGVDHGQLKVTRGGSYNQSIYDATPAYRDRANPTWGSWKARGFRLARSN